MNPDPLLTTLLDLDQGLSWPRRLMIGGGYGLFLKQCYLADHPEIQTLFAPQDMPAARTTKDIDLILGAETATDSNLMRAIRELLDQLGFLVVETAKYTQFTRDVGHGDVKVDLLSAPLREYTGRVPRDARRVKPRPSVGLHASKLEEAQAVERDAVPVPVAGQLSSGKQHATEVLVPQAFSYLLMKLFAFRDRLDDPDRDLSRHHALDLYRIVGLVTKTEDNSVRQLCQEFSSHERVIEARHIARRFFIREDGLGRLRNSRTSAPSEGNRSQSIWNRIERVTPGFRVGSGPAGYIMGGGYLQCGGFTGDDKSGSAMSGLLDALPEFVPDNRRLEFSNAIIDPLREALDGGQDFILIEPGIAEFLIPAIESFCSRVGQQLGFPEPFDAPQKDVEAGLDPLEAKWGKGKG